MDGKKLKEELKALNLTQKKFARILGVNVMTVTNWVQGKYQVPVHVDYHLVKLGSDIKPRKKPKLYDI